MAYIYDLAVEGMLNTNKQTNMRGIQEYIVSIVGNIFLHPPKKSHPILLLLLLLFIYY